MNTNTDFEPRNIADEATAACYAAPYGNGIVNQVKHNRVHFAGKPLAARNFTLELCSIHGITPSELLALASVAA